MNHTKGEWETKEEVDGHFGIYPIDAENCADLIQMTLTAQAVQDRWNSWTRRREAFSRHERLVNRILHRWNLETFCTECGAVMDTSIEPIPCIVCGNQNTCSPYYC